jgi:3-phosphoshikimate 1-carboxyvinyltransferase
MAWPDTIEIVPLPGPLRLEVAVPGSKSITNRALVLAALAQAEVTLEGALWSEDTQVMVACLQTLGLQVEVRPDPGEEANRTIRLMGTGGRIRDGGSPGAPLDLFVGNAGTAARFLAALVCLGQGCYRLHGVPRMHERPQAGLFDALRQLGYSVTADQNRLPAVITATGPRPGRCQVSIAESSQFASALLLCAHRGGWAVEVVGENRDESPYVHMTREMVRRFPFAGGAFPIESDASSGSYFWAAGWLCSNPPSDAQPDTATWLRAHSISVARWPASAWQVDARFPGFLPLPALVSREEHLGDSILTAMILAPFAAQPVRFTELGRLRVQECERVQAMRTELTRCGARVVEAGDTLTVHPGPLHGATIQTYQDHRLAMAFAVLGLRVPGLRIANPACVRKTFPNFFRKLALPPPSGLGASLLGPDRAQLAAHNLPSE